MTDFSKNGFSRRKLKKSLPKIGLFLIAVGALVVAFAGLRRAGSSEPAQLGAQVSSERIAIADAVATFDINKVLILPLKDDKGEDVSTVTLTLEKAEKRNEIVVQGKRAQSVAGRTFLIINIKIKNDYNQAINIATRDYIRLSINGNREELLAPDIHNDPVEVQPISTKLTRVGFPIYESDTDLVLFIGQISEDKEEIPLSL